jgi:glucosamine-6-phosphate deaminase
MTSSINKTKLLEICRIPVEQLENHPGLKMGFKLVERPEDVHQWAAEDMADEVKRNNAAGKPTRWILPCGPTKQYPLFARIINREQISLKNLFVFHMDEMLDWQGRPIPLEHSFSFEGAMRKVFYDPIEPGLNVPENQRFFPSIFDIDGVSKKIEALGGVDTTYAGVGYHGHIAMVEPPYSPWYTVTLEELRNSKTRILHLNDDTIVALSQRNAGGCSHLVPPMTITLGMHDMLSAKRLRFISDTGAWKRTVLRLLLLGDQSVEYPVTLAQGHADAMLVCDRNTILPPIDGTWIMS